MCLFIYINTYACVCVFVCVYIRLRVYVCLRVCVCCMYAASQKVNPGARRAVKSRIELGMLSWAQFKV